MARIGVLPTKTSIELREPDGDAGTIPAATASAAGVMTARQVQMLEEVWRAMQSGAALTIVERQAPQTTQPVIIEKAADTSHLATKAELRAVMSAIPRQVDMTPQIQAIRDEMARIQAEAMGGAQQLLQAPPVPTDTVDPVARQVLDGVISGFEALEHRVRVVEDVVSAIRTLAEIKGEEEDSK